VPGIPESILLHPLLAKWFGAYIVSQVQNHTTRINGPVFPELLKLVVSTGKSNRF